MFYRSYVVKNVRILCVEQSVAMQLQYVTSSFWMLGVYIGTFSKLIASSHLHNVLVVLPFFTYDCSVYWTLKACAVDNDGVMCPVCTQPAASDPHMSTAATADGYIKSTCMLTTPARSSSLLTTWVVQHDFHDMLHGDGAMSRGCGAGGAG